MKTTLVRFALLPLMLGSCTQVYWSDDNYPAAIHQSSLDGKTTVPVIVQTEVKGWPRSPFTLAYDKHYNRVLWQDLKGHAIKSVDRATGELGDWEVVLGPSAMPQDLCVDQKSRTVYFPVLHYENPRTYSIQAASLDSGKVWVVVPKSSRLIYTVDFDAGRNSLTYTMANSAAESFGVWRHSLKSGNSEQVVPARDLSRGAIRAALDSSGNQLFWTRNDRDNTLDGIWTMDLMESGTPKQIVRSPGTYPFEIECNRTWTGATELFWADVTWGVIVAARADGSDFHMVLDVRKDSLGVLPTGLELVR